MNSRNDNLHQVKSPLGTEELKVQRACCIKRICKGETKGALWWWAPVVGSTAVGYHLSLFACMDGLWQSRMCCKRQRSGNSAVHNAENGPKVKTHQCTFPELIGNRNSQGVEDTHIKEMSKAWDMTPEAGCGWWVEEALLD